MSDLIGAERDPHVLVSARLDEHPKIIDLPSDRARWGWVVLLGAAKLQRPAGRFASRKVLARVIGGYDRHVPDYLRVGLLHVFPDLCDECLSGLSAGRVGELVVHDWRKHQERVSRSQGWRLDNGLTSGHHNKGPGDEGETPGKHDESVPSHGRVAAPSQSQSLSQSLSNEDGDAVGAGPAIAAFEDITGLVPSRFGRWVEVELGRLIDSRGAEAVAASARKVGRLIETQPPSPRQLAMAVVKDLEPFDFRKPSPKPKGHSSVDDLARVTEVV